MDPTAKARSEARHREILLSSASANAMHVGVAVLLDGDALVLNGTECQSGPEVSPVEPEPNRQRRGRGGILNRIFNNLGSVAWPDRQLLNRVFTMTQ